MVVAALVELMIGVRAERRSLESVVAPLTAIEEKTGATTWRSVTRTRTESPGENGRSGGLFRELTRNHECDADLVVEEDR